MEYLKVLIGQFLGERNFLQSMNLCQDIIKAEDVSDPKLQEKLDWIKKHTTETLNIPFMIVETYVSKNANMPLTYSIEVPTTETRPKRYREFELIDLIIEMKKAYEGMREIVTTIAKKYSIDIPFMKTDGGSDEVPVIL
jgi:hypothetical protein